MKPTKVRFILTSSSNKKLDECCSLLKLTVERHLGVTSGPVCFKNRRLIDMYLKNNGVYNALLNLSVNRRVSIEVITPISY